MSEQISTIQKIQERNNRVEADKAWEISLCRRTIIALLTYCIASFFLWSIDAPHPLLNSLVPTGGYLLSTLSLPLIKSWWIKNIYKK